MAESDQDVTATDLRSPGADSEFDETLGVPESLTVIDIAGEPVLVESKEELDGDVDGGKSTIKYENKINFWLKFYAVNTQDVKVISFRAVHDQPIKFTSYHRKCFIPGVDINVNIINNERSVTTHLLNPNL